MNVGKCLVSVGALLILPGVAIASTPTISWQPPSVSQTMFAGTQSFTRVRIVSEVSLENISLRVVPELAPFVSVSPSEIDSLPANQALAIDIFFILPSFILPGLVEGTIQVRTDKPGVRAKPLPVAISILQSTADFIPPFVSAPSSDRIQADEESGALYATNEVDVIFRHGSDLNVIKSIVSSLSGTFLGSNPSSLYFQVRVGAEDGPSIDELVELLETRSEVAVAMRHWLLESATTPREWSSLNDDQTYGQVMVGLPGVWQIETGNPDVDLVVIDNGFDSDHLDLAPNVFIPDPPILRKEHGTLVTGILAAVEDAQGIAGVLWTADVDLYDVGLVDDPSAWDTARLEQRFHQAVFSAGIRPTVINMSGSSKPGDPDIDQVKKYFSTKLAAARLQRKQILLVAAAGNQGRIFSSNYPAALASEEKRFCNVVAVASVDQEGKLSTAPPSNFGTGVSVAAPGVRIFTTQPGNTHTDEFSGTSLASPFVAGVAGLLLAKENNRLSEFQVRDLLIEGSRINGSLVQDNFFILDAPGSFLAVDQLKNNVQGISPLIDFRTFNNGLAIVEAVDLANQTLEVKVIYSTNLGTQVQRLDAVTSPLSSGDIPRLYCSEPNHVVRLTADTEVLRGVPGFTVSPIAISDLVSGALIFVELESKNGTNGANLFLDSHLNSPIFTTVFARKIYAIPR